MEENKILELPILPLRNTVIFPSGITPLTVGRPLSLAAAEAALSTEEKLLGVLAQREDNETEPTPDNLYISFAGVGRSRVAVLWTRSRRHEIFSAQPD